MSIVSTLLQRRGVDYALMLGLRAVNIGAKVLLIYLLSSRLPTEEMGVFALVLATNMLVSTIAGGEVHRVIGREIINASLDAKARLLRDHFAFLIPASGLAAAATIGVSLLGFFPIALLPLAAAITATQVLATDQTRLLVTLERPVLSNLHMTVHNALWIFLAAPMIWFAEPGAVTLETLLAAWLGALLFSLLFGVAAAADLPWRNAVRTAVDWQAAQQRARTALPVLASTAIMVTATVADRFILKQQGYLEGVAVIFFYVSVLQITTVVVDILIYQTKYAALVRNAQKGLGDWLAVSRRVIVQSAVIAGILAPALAIGALVAAQLAGNPALESRYALAAVLGVAFFLDAQAATLVNVLYANHMDRAILNVNAADLLVTLVGGIIVIAMFGPFGAALLWLMRGIVRCAGYLHLWRTAGGRTA